MTSPSAERSRDRGRIVTAAAVAAGLVLALAAATPAEAGLPSPREVHRELREHVHDLFRHIERIPDRIESRHRRHLQVFFGGREYYAPHRHEHVIYRYPVWIGDEVHYRPYRYCGDRLFRHVEVRPRLWVEWGHGSHGAWCDHHHGYYPRQHSCFRGRGHGWGGGAHSHRHDRWCGHHPGHGWDRPDRYDRDRRDHRDDGRHDHRRYDSRRDRDRDERYDRRDRRDDRRHDQKWRDKNRQRDRDDDRDDDDDDD